LIEEIGARAARSNIYLRWTEVNGTPVAVIRLPLGEGDDSKKRVVLDQLRLSDGQLVIAGRTIESSAREGASGGVAAQGAESETRQR